MLENEHLAHGHADRNTVWGQYLLSIREQRSPEFLRLDGEKILNFLGSADPAFVDSSSIIRNEEEVESLLNLVLGSVDLQNPELAYTFFCDVIEFKNEQFSSQIALPYGPVELPRETSVITPTRFVRDETASCIRTHLIERIDQAEKLSTEDLASTALLTAIFFGALLNSRNQIAFCQTSIEVIRGRCATRGDRHPPRIFFPATGDAWVADPFTTALLEKLSKRSPSSGVRVSICLSQFFTDSNMLSFLLQLDSFFESLLNTAQSKKVCKHVKFIRSRFRSVSRDFDLIKSQNSDKQSKRKLRTEDELIRSILSLFGEFAASFFCFHMRPINLNIALGRLPTSSMQPKLHAPTNYGSYQPTVNDVSIAIGITNEKLLDVDKSVSRAFVLLLERISTHLATAELWKARCEIVKLLDKSATLDNGERVVIDETEKQLFEFLIDVANTRLEVAEKIRNGGDQTKKQIVEFLNFLSCSFTTLLRSIRKMSQQVTDALARLFDYIADREELWIDLIEHAHGACPRNAKNAWYASANHIICHLNAQGLTIDISADFEFDLSTNSYAANGTRTHYADYASVMKGLDCLYTEAKTYEREGYEKSAQICMVSYLAGVLYLHFGARLMEIIGLSWFDVQVPRNRLGNVIMRIRPNVRRDLKTGQAPRVFDLRVLPEQLLSRLLEFHANVLGDKGDRPLFQVQGMSVRVLSRHVATNITRVIRSTCNLDLLTVHSLRHAALNNVWASISLVHGSLLPETLVGLSLGDSLIAFAKSLSKSDLHHAELSCLAADGYGSNKQASCRWAIPRPFSWDGPATNAQVEDIMLAARYIHRYIYGRHLQPYESPIDAYYLLIKFAGHLEPQTTIRYYLHFLELSLSSDVQKTYPHLKRDQIYRLFDVNKDWVTRRLKDRPLYFSDLQWLALQG